MNQRISPPATLPPNRRLSTVSRRDREFLPAALEILETPPPPMSTVAMMTICAFFAAALAWSYIGRLDVHAIAPGKIEIVGHAKVIQSLEPGRIAAIRVASGARVTAGDVLLELDPTEAEADVAAQSAVLDASIAEIARRAAAIEIASTAMRVVKTSETGEDLPQAALLSEAASTARDRIGWPDDASKSARSRESAVLTADLLQLTEALNGVGKQIAEKASLRERVEMSLSFQRKLIETLTQRVDTRQDAIDLKVGTKTNLFDAQEELERAQSAFASDEGQIIEATAGIRLLNGELTKIVSQFIADNENKRAEVERRVEEVRDALTRAQARLRRTKLRAPIDGVVRQLAVTTIGQVVAPGQDLVVVTPSNAPLEVEALVANGDIANVKEGQEAQIKVDAFPFTRFGAIRGRIVRVATEAIEEQEARRGLANPNTLDTAVTTPAGSPETFVFPVVVALDRPVIQAEGVANALAPGMTVSVEIKTGSRRVIDYLLSPLGKIASEAMREQ